MKRNGSISVFLSLLLAVLLVLDLALLESARVSGLKYMEKQAGESAIAALESGYIRQLFDGYGLLFYDGAMGAGWLKPEAVAEEFESYFRRNLSTGLTLSGKSFFGVGTTSAKVKEIITATDYGGAAFVENALAYFPYDAAGTLLEEIREQLNRIGEGDAVKSETDRQEQERKDTDWSDYEVALRDANRSGYEVAVWNMKGPGSEAAVWNMNRSGYEAAVWDKDWQDYEAAVWAKDWSDQEVMEGDTELAGCGARANNQWWQGCKLLTQDSGLCMRRYPGQGGGKEFVGEGEDDRKPGGGNPAERPGGEGDSDGPGGGKTPEEPEPKNAYNEKRYHDEVENSPIGNVNQVKAKGWLSLVIPKGRSVSAYEMDQSEAPSRAMRDTRKTEDDPLDDMLKRVAFQEYLLMEFACFTDEKATDSTQYEVEYLLYGKASDEDNLKAVLNRLMWIREGMNILYLAQCAEKMELVHSMAMLMAGWTEIPVLVVLTEVGLVAAWAYAEALMDVKTLLAGNRVPVVKSEETWALGLENVGDFMRGSATAPEKGGEGLSYKEYLRLLLYLSDATDTTYRAMDLIQAEMQKHDPAFKMSAAVSQMKVEITAGSSPLFSRIPLVWNMGAHHMDLYFYKQEFSFSYE